MEARRWKNRKRSLLANLFSMWRLWLFLVVVWLGPLLSAEPAPGYTVTAEQLQILTSKLMTLQEANTNLQSGLQALKLLSVSQTGSLQDLESTLAAQTQKLQDLQAQSQGLEQTISDLQAKSSNTESEMAKAQESLTTASNEVELLTKAQEQLEKSFQIYKQQVADEKIGIGIAAGFGGIFIGIVVGHYFWK